MPKFYVLATLVINAEDVGEADARAEDLLGALVNLEPAALDGYTLLAESAASPASDNWAERMQYVSDIRPLTVEEN